MEFLQCLNDQSLGPTIKGCRDDFDFTIKFEQVFLSILPSCIFIAAALLRITQLLRRQAIVGGRALQRIKTAVIGIHSLLQASLIAVSSTSPGRFRPLFVASTSSSFVAAILAAILSHLEHSRSPRPSILLTAYLTLSALLGAAQTRTLWLASATHAERTFTILSTTAVAVYLVAILLESQPKVKWIDWDEKRHSPEETSGLFDIGAFFWLNRLFLSAYGKILTQDDLYPLDQRLLSESLQANLAQHLEQSTRLKEKNGLARVLARSLWSPLLLPVGPRIAMIAFQFCQPFLISLLLDYVRHSQESSSRNIGYGLIGATFLVYTGLAVSSAFYWYLQERAMCMVRGSLGGAVYRKVLGAKLTAVNDSGALTLMSADVERVTSGGMNIHELWANIIQVGLASWLLSKEIGVAAVAPLIVVLASVVLSSFLSKLTRPRQKAWMEKIQKRVGLTSNVIRHMKDLKISGLATAVEDVIQNMRVGELKTASKFRSVITFAAVIANVPLCVSPVVTFVFASGTLDITTIFTAISYILLLASPLSTLLQMIPALLSAFTCLDRIREFLATEPRVDLRSLLKDARGTDSKETGPGNNDASTSGHLIEITDGRFGWDFDKPSISRINLHIPASKLTIVVGPVAAGKSTLCKALLGETTTASGRIRMGTSIRQIGYCDQTPHLWNSTLRQNILGFASYDEGRYEEVLDATMLKPDLESLPLRDETKLGSNGITLSGGQKQRVALARALYAESDFLILDDILSGLDADTAENVFLRVFSPAGLLRRRKATVVLCTHATKRLAAADYIIAMQSDGTIAEQGTFSDLMENEGYVRSLGVEEDTTAYVEDETRTSKSPAFSTTVLKATGPLPANFGDDKSRMTGDIAVYRHYFSRLNRWSLVAFITFGAGWGFFSNFTTIWLKFWSEDITSADPRHTNAFYIGLYALFQSLTLACLMFVCMVCFRSMIQISGARLHKEALSTVINAPLTFFSTTDTGIVTNLFSQDMNLVDGELPMALINLNNRLFTTLGMAAVVATTSVYLIIAFPILGLIIYTTQKFYLRTSRQLRLLDLEAKSPLYSQFIDAIKGVATIRAFGWVKEATALNDLHLDDSQRPAYLLAMIQRWLQFILQLLVAVLATGVVALATQLRTNSAFAGASLVTLMTFGNSLSFLIRVYTVVETSIGAVSRLKSFTESVKSEKRPGETTVPPQEWPMSGTIEISGVSASYEDTDNDSLRAASNDDSKPSATSRPLALIDLTLSLSSGEKVAVCGRTGSGKSSLLLLLLRLLDPEPSCSMNITIDDIPLHSIDRSILRQRIIAVPQDPIFLPNGSSYRANLDTEEYSTTAECQDVLEKVGLWAAVDQRGGLDGPMTAENFSQGQKQLFSLARAMIRRRSKLRARQSAFGGEHLSRDGGVLILDEFSSSVDRDTEEIMQDLINTEFESYTVVMITHRLEFIMKLENVVVMESGRIIEMGKPSELVQSENSKFRELWRSENNQRLP